MLPRLRCQIKAPTRSRLIQTGASGALIWPGTVRQGFLSCDCGLMTLGRGFLGLLGAKLDITINFQYLY